MGLLSDIVYAEIYSDKYEEEMDVSLVGKIVYNDGHKDSIGRLRFLDYTFVENENGELELKVTCISSYRHIDREEIEDNIICLYNNTFYVYSFYKIDYTEYDDLQLYYKQCEECIRISDADINKIKVLGLNSLNEELIKGLYNKYKKN